MIIGIYLKLFFVTLLFIAASFTAHAQNVNPQARKFDEFSGKAHSEDIKARLDFFAIELQKQSDVQGHIIMYRSRREPPGISYRYVERARYYLVETRGLASNRILAVDAGISDDFLYELWLVPVGVSAPEKRYTYKREDSDITYLFDLLDTWGNDDVEMPPGVGGSDWHLSGFAAELKKNSKARGYIIAYPQYCKDCRYDGHKSILLRDSDKTIQNILRSKKKYLIQEQGYQSIKNSHR